MKRRRKNTKGKGWHNEPNRHSLAAMGVETTIEDKAIKSEGEAVVHEHVNELENKTGAEVISVNYTEEDYAHFLRDDAIQFKLHISEGLDQETIDELHDSWYIVDNTNPRHPEVYVYVDDTLKARGMFEDMEKIGRRLSRKAEEKGEEWSKRGSRYLDKKARKLKKKLDKKDLKNIPERTGRKLGKKAEKTGKKAGKKAEDLGKKL